MLIHIIQLFRYVTWLKGDVFYDDTGSFLTCFSANYCGLRGQGLKQPFHQGWVGYENQKNYNVGVAIINHSFLMVYTTHLW